MNRQQTPRAWVRQPSGRRLDLANPTPFDWDDRDLAIGLARTFRWGGHSVWPRPLSVAQHSLLVLALRRRMSPAPLERAVALRELLHDAEEGLIGFDPISPLKPILGDAFAALMERLTQAVFLRYGLPAWSADEKRLHKDADRLAAASEAVHVAGWSAAEVRSVLGIKVRPLADDPLLAQYGGTPWEPWPASIAAERFLAALSNP
ncbi:phosphohydrolase [Azonexus sp.]|uniref:phosphohydrolase n=1 Tax=Azonexus sp. TaxID=1872668 RepID=UPI0035B4D23B